MKPVLLALLAVSIGSFAFAQAPAAPASAATQPASGILTVYIAPFSESGSLVRPGWLSDRLTTALRDNLDDIPNVTLVEPSSDERASNAINQVYFDRAKNAGAEIAVIGASSVSGDKINVSGNIYDVSNGNSFGNFKASGTTRDLFNVEDSTIKQVRTLVSKLAAPVPNQSAATTNPGGYVGSDLQADVNNYDYRGLQLSNADSTRYDQQPYHVVEQPNIQFLLPYDYGYGYGGYSYYNPYYWSGYVNPFGFGYGNSWWPSFIIINTGNGHNHHHDHGSGFVRNNPTTVTPTPHTLPPEVRTRNATGSLVATPPPNTIQRTPSYEAKPPSYEAKPPSYEAKPPSYEIRPTDR